MKKIAMAAFAVAMIFASITAGASTMDNQASDLCQIRCPFSGGCGNCPHPCPNPVPSPDPDDSEPVNDDAPDTDAPDTDAPDSDSPAPSDD